MTKSMIMIMASAALAIVPGVSSATPRGGDVAREGAAAPAPVPTDVKKRYCAVETLTGSHIQKKECMSREQWIKTYGTDPAKR